tara:strand:- start:8080 stop:9252 length:1173 start_codon:yes stop_codon:yes gene_type:complete
MTNRNLEHTISSQTDALKLVCKNITHYSKKSLGTILCIGAGTGSDLNNLVGLQPKKVISIESSLQLFKILQKKAEKYKNVFALNEWVIPGENRNVDVCLYNNPRYNCIYDEQEQKEKVNIKLLEKVEVDGISLRDILEKFPVSGELLNIIILSFSGSLRFIIQETDSKVLESFDFVILVDSNPKEESEQDYEDIQGGKFTCFLMTLTTESCVRVYRRNDAYIGLLYMREELEIKAQTAQLEAKNAKVQIEGISEERDRFKQHVADQKSLSEKLITECSDLRAKIAELNALLLEAKNECIELTQRKEEFEKSEIELRDRLERSESLNVLNLKLLTKSQENEEQLREQVAEQTNEIDRLQSLISELGRKLGDASNIYSKLIERHPDLKLESF